MPKGSSWGSPGSSSFDHETPDCDKYTYHYDVASARDTYMYALFDEGIWNDHSEFMGRSIEYFGSQQKFGPNTDFSPRYDHGSGVAAMVIGNQVGICPSCTLVVATSESPRRKVEKWYDFPNKKIIAQLIDTHDDVKKKKRQGKSAINMSFSYGLDTVTSMFHIVFRQLLEKLDNEGFVVVVSANNHAKSEKIFVRRYPAKFGDPNDQYGGPDNLIVVAAANWKTERADFSNYSPFVTTFAPGKDIHCPADKFLDPGKNMVTCSGTSFAAPQVAALANYFRSVPSPWQSQLSKTSNVKKLIQLFARRFAVHSHNVDPAGRRPIIWNGQVGEHSCLRDYRSKEDWAKVCPSIQDSLEDQPMNPGEPVEPCGAGQSGNPPKNPHGMPPPPPPPHQKPTSTSTTTGTSPTTTSSPPVETVPLCLGKSTTPTSQFPLYAYSIYAPGYHCDGMFVTDDIGSSPKICSVHQDEFTFDWCKKDDAKFVDEGPEFFGECGYQISINGN
ncbi:hypothetical protein N7501_007401 [Penicillium viridicatum]|nr:hypothetical protein N7501_007401 [Penicillium viridicatum]